MTRISRNTLSAALFLAICVLTILDALFGIEAAGWTAAISVVIFLILEFTWIANLQRIVGLVLVSLGFIAGALVDDFLTPILDGLRRTLPFLLLFASVAWLQIPANLSPGLLAIRETALAQPPGRRFAVIGLAGHYLGVAFNLAGLSLLTPMVGRDTPLKLRQRLGRAMIQGFAAGTSWSPFYVGTAVILATVPGVRWIEVAPAGFALAMILIGWSWCYDRLFVRRPDASETRTDHAPKIRLTLKIAGNVVFLLCSLFGATVILVEGLLLSIPVSLAIVAPPFALIWARLISRQNTLDESAGISSKQLVQSVFQKLPDLRGEVLLFASANIMGVGAATLIDPEVAVAWLTGIASSELTLVPLLMGGMVLTSMIGLHPVVYVVLVTAVFTPDAIGIAPQIVALGMMAMWGQGTNSSPFSATVLYMSRITGESNWAIAWRWNAPYVLTCTIILIALILILQEIGYFQAFK